VSPRAATRTLLAAAALAWSCGEPAPDRAPPSRAAPVATRADPAGRTAVATVNGEPIYGDCVATQAAAEGIDRETALARCVDFELLAQEAARRGLIADRDVLEVRRTEMVRALVEADFAPTLDEPSDVPIADVRWLWDTQLARRYNRPELRRATYCRAPVAKGAAADGPEDQQARKLAQRLFAELDRMRGLDAARFAELCTSLAGDEKVDTTKSATRGFSREGRHEGGAYAASFAQAAFSVAAAGQVSSPTRTQWGWDLVLVTEILPAESRSFEQAGPEIRDKRIHLPETAEYRQRKFMTWLAPLMKATRIEVFADRLPEDQALAHTAAPPAGATR